MLDMPRVTPEPGRARLGFKEAVLASFTFLRSFGFKPVQQEVTFVRYESPEMFVNIYHGRASYELNVEIGNQVEPNERIRLDDLIAWADAENTEGFGQHTTFQVSSFEGVQEFVPKLAELVKKYGTSLLRNDPQAFISVLKSRDSRAHDYIKQMRLRDVRAKAEAAWQNKDYSDVVEFYGSIRADLTESETMKLAYAKKQFLSSRSKAH